MTSGRASFDDINDEPWFWQIVGGVDVGTSFLVRIIGEKMPFGIVIAYDRDQLFWLIDELTDPYLCEVSVVRSGAFFGGIDNLAQHSENLDENIEADAAWRPVDNGSLFPEEKAVRLSRLKVEVRSLERLIGDLGGKVNARNRKHVGHQGKNDGALGKA